MHSEVVHNYQAPREVVPLLLGLCSVKSVIDVGCGIGTWLKIFEESGITDYFGIDGVYVDPTQLKIPASKFSPVDLREDWSINRRFDMAICLEVAEHLPEYSSDLLVEKLTKLGDVIVFSAAIPGQDGQNHLNEQWPEYWQCKFARHGFYFHDVVRPLIWSNEKVDWWYRQNIFLVKREKPAIQPFSSLSIVHPELLKLKNLNEREYFDSLMAGKQGIRLGVAIFFNSLKFKIRNLLRLK